VTDDTTTLRAQSETPLQSAMLKLAEILGDVRRLDGREQAVFADLAERAIVQSLGGPMVVDEAEDITRLAA
jgi:hypothetical protein